MSSGEWWRVAVVATVGIGAGVAVAGLPTSLPSARIATAPSTPAEATTAAPVVTVVVAPTSDPAPSTTMATTQVTATTTTTTTAAPPAIRAATRVVVANAGTRDGLAASGQAALTAAGYAFVIVGDAAEQRDASVVLYAPGKEREARRAATDLGLAATAIEPLAGQPVVGVDVRGADLVALLANDVAL